MNKHVIGTCFSRIMSATLHCSLLEILSRLARKILCSSKQLLQSQQLCNSIVAAVATATAKPASNKPTSYVNTNVYKDSSAFVSELLWLIFLNLPDYDKLSCGRVTFTK